MAWVTNEGEYGQSEHMSFDGSKLSDEQWGRLEEMADSDRYDYADAILHEDDANVRLIEFENFGEEWGL